jgi:hypothetical protein
MERAEEKAKKQKVAIAKMKADAIEKAKKDAALRIKLAGEKKKAEEIAEAKAFLKKKL